MNHAKHKAYSVLDIKTVDEDRRILEGIATTPAPDRINDVVVPEGIEFKLPFPLLYQHNASKPIGSVTEAKVTSAGMKIKAIIAKPGVAGFIDEAWALIKSGLVRGLSIGFRSLEESWDKQLGGYRYLRTELLELSAVTIPANAEATITAVKSADGAPAALGQRARESVAIDCKTNPPGASGQTKERPMKTIGEQIAALEAKRQANVARKEALRVKASEEGRVMDQAEAEEFDGLDTENESIDQELTRLRRHQKQIETAIPVTEEAGSTPAAGSRARGLVVIPRNQPPVQKGTSFVRLAMALMASHGDRAEAYDMVRGQKSWKETTPEVERLLSNPQAVRIVKVAVAAGTTTADGWASELADYNYMASEFIEYLRPQTIIGKIPNLRRVPFNIRIPLQDTGSTVGWVGEGAQKPVSKLHFDTATFRFAKAAGIVVVTEELVRFSNPAAEDLVRADLTAQMAQFLDVQFIDPTVVAVPNVNPGAISNGAGTTAASGTTADDFRADLKLALTQMINANLDPSGLVIVMQPILAVSLSLLRTALGSKEFPEINASGGSIEGYQVVTSNSVPSGVVVFVKPQEILIADDGGISIDASREASLIMDDGVSPATTTMVSLWQKNLVALRVERIINWARRRAAAVYYLTAAAYGSTSP